MAARISGLDAFGLLLAALSRLGARAVLAYAHLNAYEITPAVVRVKSSDRHEYLVQRAERWIARLRRRFPTRSFEVRSDTAVPSSLSVRLDAREVAELARQPGVRSVHVTRISGLRTRQKPKQEHEWYCVRARVAVQVEGQSRGLQTIEDRFVLVRARSFQDAESRLSQEWREYAAPYLNQDGQLVRWQCEEIVDVYSTCESDLEAKGVEVYSKLSARRMKSRDSWHPRRGV
jgi:hypothetical protein